MSAVIDLAEVRKKKQAQENARLDAAIIASVPHMESLYEYTGRTYRCIPGYEFCENAT